MICLWITFSELLELLLLHNQFSHFQQIWATHKFYEWRKTSNHPSSSYFVLPSVALSCSFTSSVIFNMSLTWFSSCSTALALLLEYNILSIIFVFSSSLEAIFFLFSFKGYSWYHFILIKISSPFPQNFNFLLVTTIHAMYQISTDPSTIIIYPLNCWKLIVITWRCSLLDFLVVSLLSL